MTLSRNKPPWNFRSRRHTNKYRNSERKSEFNFQKDLKSQQATVEFQIPKAYQKNTEILKENRNSISRMTLNRNKQPLDFRYQRHTQKYRGSYIKSEFHSQNDFKSQQATIEFQIPKAYPKTQHVRYRIGFRLPEWP